MMLFESQVKKSKPRSGADVAGLAKIAGRLPTPGNRERAEAIGKALFRAGGGVHVVCANPNAMRPAAPDERTMSRIAIGKYISPPVLRSIQKSADDGAPPPAEPMPRPDQADLDFLWSPVVNPDLRNALVTAVKERHGAERIGSPDIMLAWDNSVAYLRDAIAELIERIGPEASSLSRILDGGAGGKMAAARNAAFQRSAMADYSASIREGAAVRKGRIAKFYDMAKGGDDGDEPDFDWFSYGKTTLHGYFDSGDRKVAELYRGSIARAPSLVNDAGFHAWGRKMLRKYNLSAPMAKGVLGYITGSFA